MNKINEPCITFIENLITPNELVSHHPISKNISEKVTKSRKRIEKILSGKDSRLLVIIGPCSIHDLESAIDYANRLKTQRDKHLKHLEIVMRTYFEKPRTSVGWKGLIFDPDLNNSYRVNHGIKLARKLLLQLVKLGIPTATEFLNITTRQFISDLISWGSIGARTSESQIHREMASALSCPIGFKNSTDGNIRVAVDAVRSSRISHTFLSPNKNGKISLCKTSGNLFGHIIMRGGKKPNFYKKDISLACKILRMFNLPEYLIVDLSHGNCQRQYQSQLDVCDEICKQISNGSNAIVGVMVESFLKGGTQKLTFGNPIVYGQSITDPCLSWEESEFLLEKLASAVNNRLNSI